MKARYLKEGLDSFEDHQVLEMLLFYAIPMKDTNELAHKMIGEFGSLSNLFEASPADISARCQVSENIAILVSLIPSLTRKYYQGKWGDKPVLDSSAKAGNFAVSLFAGRTLEVFFAICLDLNSKLTCASLVHEGTINEVAVYPRRIVEAAIRHHAVTVILAHNHPGGTLKPSQADKQVTKMVKDALRGIAVNLADHIIVVGDKYYSFSENDLI